MVKRTFSGDDATSKHPAAIDVRCRNDPASEATPIHTPCNPYGNTKMILERILNEVCEAHEEWRVIILRYFNPIGAHPRYASTRETCQVWGDMCHVPRAM